MSRRTKLACGLTIISVALAVSLSIQPHATATTGAQTSTGVEPSGTWVTLITGDRVFVHSTHGRTSLVVDPALRTGLTRFQQFTVDGDQYVLPTDALMLVRDGVLDRQLFNVTGLMRQGYDDAHMPSIPLLVRYADATTAKSAGAPVGGTVRRTLRHVDMKALDELKGRTAEFWGRELTTFGKGGRKFASGVQQVWLNGKVRAGLDESVPQIGAPDAWSQGLTGTGVTVAVLDSGIDSHHVDLAARVGPSMDFTGKGNVEDGHGHGTHVASIVAGSGAVADGKYQGVAPHATLAIGKVLDDSGSGSFDDVIAGMEWAASQSGAKVVNLSLGARGAPSNGSDPVSVALNDLTNEYGTLFVVAAGNAGGDETVSSPAVADKALAVGSVSKDNVLSEFSSRGPRLGDGAVKPELAAPGENIVAARPAGVDPLGEPVGNAYQRLSGTSMAAPHVAGSAALLIQQHPEWRADRLKAALMSTAVEISGGDPYAVGTGRVDVARATTQRVTATGSVSTYLAWPNQGNSKRQTVTWHNTGTAAVTLSLSVSLTGRDGQAAPPGLVVLDAGTVTVPAGGDAPVDYAVVAQDGGSGEYSGILTARNADGTVMTRTALAVYQEEEQYTLTVNLIDRDGAPVTAGDSQILLIDLNHAGSIYTSTPGEQIRLPRGQYALNSSIITPRSGQEPTVSLISHPELSLDRDTVQALDARDGKPMSITTDNPAAQGGFHVVHMLSAISDCGCTYAYNVITDPRFYQIYAATVPGTRSETFAAAQELQAYEPPLRLSAQVGTGFEVPVGWLSDPPPAAHETYRVVYGGSGTPEDLAKIDARGKLVLAEIPSETSWDELVARTADMKAAGAKLAMLVPADATFAAAVTGSQTEPALPTMSGAGPTVRRFVALVKSGEVPAEYVNQPYPRYRYELHYGVSGQLATAQVHRPMTKDLVAVQTAYHDNAIRIPHSVLASAEFFGRTVDVGWTMAAVGGQERTEYFTPGTWWLFDQAGGDVATEAVQLEAGHGYHIAWNKAVAGPTFRGTTRVGPNERPWAMRKHNVVDVILPMHGDSAGRPRVLLPDQYDFDRGSISLYREEQLVGTVPGPVAARFDVPEAAARYRLVAEANRAADWWPLSTKVAAAWTFHSLATGGAQALPLLTVRLDPAVDLRNRAPADGWFSFPAYVARQDTNEVRVRSLTVDVSYDDGRTWKRAAVSAAGGHWNVSLKHPATGYASLRAKATDVDGNTVEQTVLRAYQIASADR